MMQFLPIAILSIMFLLSLTGAVVLFGYLKSTAKVKRPSIQLGGALAGFFVIYNLLSYSYGGIVDKLSAERLLPWTVIGVAHKHGAATHDGIIVKHIPPRPSTVTDTAGNFTLENVSVTRGSLPNVILEGEGYYPRPFEVRRDNAVIDWANATIKLKDPVELDKIPRGNP